MGTMRSLGMAEAVREGHLTLEAALHDHLTANMYPPVPVSLIPACKQAVELVGAGEPSVRVQLPQGRRVAAALLVEAFRLEAFVERPEPELCPKCGAGVSDCATFGCGKEPP